MADGRRDQDWRRRQSGGRDMGNRYGGGDYDRTNFGSRGSGYPDDVDAGYGADRSPNYPDRADMWDDSGRFSFDRNYHSRGDANDRTSERNYGSDYNRDYDRGGDYNRDRGGFGGSYSGRYTTDNDRQNPNYPDRVGRGGYGGGERNWMDKAGDEVSSWFGDDQAAQRRDEDKRRDGHYGRGPKGYRRTDARITEDVNDRLTDDWQLDATNIIVEVKDGEVTLSGTVDDRQSKRRAEDLAEQCSGVTHVQNNLRVQLNSQSGVSSGNTGGSSTPGSSGLLGGSGTSV